MGCSNKKSEKIEPIIPVNKAVAENNSLPGSQAGSLPQSG